jgi:hypothetical protein
MRRRSLITVLSRLAAVLGVLTSLVLLGTSTAAADGELPSFTVRAIGPGAIAIDYAHSGTGGVVRYELHRQDAPLIGVLYSPNGQFIDSYLQPSTVYFYKVCVLYEDDDQPLCPPVWVRGETQAAPEPPSQQPAVAPWITNHVVDQTSIKAWWSAGRAWEHYHVSWIADGFTNGPEEEVGCDCPDGYRHIKGLQPDRRYRVIVKGCDENFWGDDRCSPWSAPFEFRTLAVGPPPPPQPVGVGTPTLTATVQSIRSVALSFFVTTDVISNDDRFLVYRDNALIAERPAPGTWGGLAGTHTDTVRSGASYTYHVCFRNSATTECSDPVVVKVPGVAGPPVAGAIPTQRDAPAPPGVNPYSPGRPTTRTQP